MTCLDLAPTLDDVDDDSMTHIYCVCSPDIALCGETLEIDLDFDYTIEAACVVCVDLEQSPTFRCARCNQ